jgi:hypothetical protein
MHSRTVTFIVTLSVIVACGKPADSAQAGASSSSASGECSMLTPADVNEQLRQLAKKALAAR